jgi:hypothetical protein
MRSLFESSCLCAMKMDRMRWDREDRFDTQVDLKRMMGDGVRVIRPLSIIALF